MQSSLSFASRHILPCDTLLLTAPYIHIGDILQIFPHELCPVDGEITVGNGLKYLADSVGISEVYGGQSPEEKVALVIKETKLAKTAYLGDGINDAPALMVATVGIAFGKNSDITAAAGYLPPVVGAICQELIDVLAIVNSLRTLWKPGQLSDMPVYPNAFKS